MMQTTAVVVGAGHAGVAMSRRLTERSIDHVVLERGQVANSWRTQRWPSLRLLTPNWQTRLPGHDYAGDDPDGYMPAADVAATLTRYAHLIGAPVRTGTTVHTVRAAADGFEIRANDDLLCARAVVLATGACTLPAIPGIAGRLGRITDRVAQFSGSLANICALADLKMNRFLNRADQWATASGLDGELPPPHRFAPTRVDPRSPLELDLRSGEIATVLWATGFRPDHSWLDIPVRDRAGHIRHDGGVVTGAPGLYVLGLPVLRTRASTYIHGAAADSEALAAHLHSFLSQRR
jgi:hypothetical protein